MRMIMGMVVIAGTIVRVMMRDLTRGASSSRDRRGLG